MLLNDILQLVVLLDNYTTHISDLEVLGRNSDNYTYVSDAHKISHNTTSWLDHIIHVCSHNMHQHISSIEILEKITQLRSSTSDYRFKY